MVAPAPATGGVSPLRDGHHQPVSDQLIRPWRPPPTAQFAFLDVIVAAWRLSRVAVGAVVLASMWAIAIIVVAAASAWLIAGGWFGGNYGFGAIVYQFEHPTLVGLIRIGVAACVAAAACTVSWSLIVAVAVQSGTTRLRGSDPDPVIALRHGMHCVWRLTLGYWLKALAGMAPVFLVALPAAGLAMAAIQAGNPAVTLIALIGCAAALAAGVGASWYLLTRLACTSTVWIAEDRGVMAGLRRSWILTGNARLASFGVIALQSVLMGAALGLPMRFLSIAAQISGSAVIVAIYVALSFCASVAQYVVLELTGTAMWAELVRIENHRNGVTTEQHVPLIPDLADQQ